MKRIALILAALTFAAGTAFAYVQPTQTPPQTPYLAPSDDQGAISGSSNSDPGGDAYSQRPGGRPPRERPPGDATNPVPEPGTMMLASMGLLALGAAVHRRRH